MTGLPTSSVFLSNFHAILTRSRGRTIENIGRAAAFVFVIASGVPSRFGRSGVR